MNIMINNYCNLQCEYCFAHDAMINGNSKEMSRENFNKVISFQKKNNIDYARIIGGEPTIHPDFIYFLNRLTNDKFYKRIHIFSNMTFNEDVLQAIKTASNVKQVTILPNWNQKEIVGDENYEKMLNNLESLMDYNRGIINTIGVNFYDSKMDYSYIYDIANKYNIPNIRWSITVPNHEMGEDFDVREHFRSYLPLLNNFFLDSVRYRRNIHQDCNKIPPCVLSAKEFRNLAYCAPECANVKSCSAIIDVKPDLEVIRCFGLSEDYSLRLENYETIKEIKSEFNNHFRGLETKPLFEQCTNCIIYKRNNYKSCGCLNYKK